MKWETLSVNKDSTHRMPAAFVIGVCLLQAGNTDSTGSLTAQTFLRMQNLLKYLNLLMI